MSDAGRETETGAIVVVGDDTLAGQLRQGRGASTRGAAEEHGGAEVVAVDHYLAVLGEMSQRPVAAVVGRLSPLRSSLEATVRAMRALEPAAKLLLVTDAEQEPEAMRAVRLGFDDYYVEPLKLAPLLAQLNGRLGGVASMPSIDGHAQQPAAEPPDTPTEAVDAPDLLPDEDATDDPLLMDEPLRMVPAGMDAGEQIAAGDGDLVEQLLRDRRGLRQAAVQKLQQRLGDPHLRFAVKPTAGALTEVPVENAGQRLGYLVSERLDARTLTPHAAWLARWLMLGRHLRQLNDMAMRDGLTGVWNRRYFEQTLRVLIDRARARRFRVTLMLFDIDDFKSYNDRFGHAAGDEILSETARLMQSVVRKQDVVARIGGDEFAVIFWDAEPPRGEDPEGTDHPQSVRLAAARFQRAVCEHRFPKLAEQAPGTLTISGGLASFPWDGRTFEQLNDLADEMMLESKQQGKNAITFGPGALRLCGVPGQGSTS